MLNFQHICLSQSQFNCPFKLLQLSIAYFLQLPLDILFLLHYTLLLVEDVEDLLHNNCLLLLRLGQPGAGRTRGHDRVGGHNLHIWTIGNSAKLRETVPFGGPTRLLLASGAAVNSSFCCCRRSTHCHCRCRRRCCYPTLSRRQQSDIFYSMLGGGPGHLTIVSRENMAELLLSGRATCKEFEMSAKAEQREELEHPAVVATATSRQLAVAA